MVGFYVFVDTASVPKFYIAIWTFMSIYVSGNPKKRVFGAKNGKNLIFGTGPTGRPGLFWGVLGAQKFKNLPNFTFVMLFSLFTNFVTFSQKQNFWSKFWPKKWKKSRFFPILGKFWANFKKNWKFFFFQNFLNSILHPIKSLNPPKKCIFGVILATKVHFFAHFAHFWTHFWAILKKINFIFFGL